jgi:hypothetical protein
VWVLPITRTQGFTPPDQEILKRLFRGFMGGVPWRGIRGVVKILTGILGLYTRQRRSYLGLYTSL